MPGQRINYDPMPGCRVNVVAGYMVTSRALRVDQDVDDPLDGWWWDAGTRRPVGERVPVSLEYRVCYPQAWGCLMMIQVVWAPAADIQILRDNNFAVDQMTAFGDGLAAIDGGRVAPARLRVGAEAPHATYPFFAYNAAYYKPLRGRGGVTTFRHKDYASAALSHSALIFDCALVAKLKAEHGAHAFGVIDTFKWGMDNYKEVVLMRQGAVSALMTQVLASEYPNVRLTALDDVAKIDAAYTPFARVVNRQVAVAKGGRSGGGSFEV